MRLHEVISSAQRAVAAFLAHQRTRRKDVAQREAAVRGPVYVATKLASHLAGGMYNDLVYGWQKRSTPGQIKLGQKAAIYLIFPDQGLLQSHKDALAYMIRKGFAPLVVSNLALSDSDRSALAPLSYLLIERVNFGYDFGGYRDGVLALRNVLNSLDSMAFFNDSSWFPITGKTDCLDQAALLDLDFVGASWGNFAHPDRLRDIDHFEFSFDPQFRSFHYQSYALLCGAAFLRSRKFLSFWKRLGLSRLKHLTIRRGEIGFSQLAIRNGFRHGATLDPARLVTNLQSLPDAALHEVLATLPLQPGDEKLAIERAPVIAASAFDRDLAIKVILLGLSRHSVANIGFRYLIDHQGFSFLKKQTLWLSADSASKAMPFIDRIEGRFGDTIRDEARRLVQTRRQD